MNNFKQTIELLDRLDETTREIFSRALEFSKDLARPSRSELLQEVIDECENLSTEDAIEHCKSVIVELTEDATRVKAELPGLIKSVDIKFEFDFSSRPLLYEVWSGDTYDKEGVEGLQALLSDLNEQKEKLTTEGIVNSVKKLCTEGTEDT